MLIHVLSGKKLQPFLRRQMAISFNDRDLRLEEFLSLVLEKANAFVPSESGSIFLDDPLEKRRRSREKSTLAAVACFGRKAKSLLGKRIPASEGIVGRVYVSGQPYFSRNVAKDRHFSQDLDHSLGHKTKSVLCVPISIRGSMVGVLELINKKGNSSYVEKDFELLRIFADYISASIQNFLDAKRNAELAKIDTLTGLNNDRFFHSALKKEVKRAWSKGKPGRDLALLFMDLDNFKEVNDEHGHLAGSRVLYEVAEVLRAAIVWPDAVMARYGGDEYVILLPNANASDAMAVGEQIRVAIERAIFLATSTTDVPALRLVDMITASIGIASFWPHVGSSDSSRLLKAADEAMYVSKRNGRNRVTVATVKRERGKEVTQ